MTIEMVAGMVGLVGGVSGGIIAVAKSYNKVDYETHREICHTKSVEVYGEIKEIRKEMNQYFMEMRDTLGFIRGKMEK